MKKVFTTGQVAKICKVAPRTVSKWFDSGRLKGYRIPGSQDRRIPREQLIRFLKEHGMPLGELEEEEWHKVLLIGTEKLFNDRLKEFLPEDEDYKFETANSGFEAGILAGSFHPDTIIIDLSLGPQRSHPDHRQPAEGRGLRHDPDRRAGERGRGRSRATRPVRVQRHLQEAVRPRTARREDQEHRRREAGRLIAAFAPCGHYSAKSPPTHVGGLSSLLMTSSRIRVTLERPSLVREPRMNRRAFLSLSAISPLAHLLPSVRTRKGACPA